MKHTMFRSLALLAVVVSFLLASVPTQQAYAGGECIGDTNGRFEGFCVRILKTYIATDGRLIVTFQGGQAFDFYQIRWARPGRGDTQVKVGGNARWWGLGNPWHDTVYTLKVQGCTSGFFGSSCTNWSVQNYRTPR